MVRLYENGQEVGFAPMSTTARDWFQRHAETIGGLSGPALWVDAEVGKVLALALVAEGITLEVVGP
jgi:hypothetical protein